MDALEIEILKLIKKSPGRFAGQAVADALHSRIDFAVIGLVNQGYLNFKLDWTLEINKTQVVCAMDKLKLLTPDEIKDFVAKYNGALATLPY